MQAFAEIKNKGFDNYSSPQISMPAEQAGNLCYLAAHENGRHNITRTLGFTRN